MTSRVSCIVTLLIISSFRPFAAEALNVMPAMRARVKKQNLQHAYRRQHVATAFHPSQPFIPRQWRRIRHKHLVLLLADSSSDTSLNDGDGSDSSDDGDGGTTEVTKKNPIEIELEELQHALELIEALEIRNESQLDSFIDKHDQWDSLEEEERVLLSSKEYVKERIDILSEELIQLWMGTKSMDG